MTFPTTAQLPFFKTQALPLELPHRLERLENKQRRLAGRFSLVPVIDLNSYRFHAVYDWISFKMHLGRPTQVQHVQRELRKFLDRDSHIHAEDMTAGSVFTTCTIKIQEPANLTAIHTIHRALAAAFGEALRSRVTGLEVSLDVYPREPSDNARSALLGALQRTIWTDRDVWAKADSRPRSTHGRGAQATRKLSPSPELDDFNRSRLAAENHEHPAIDGTMYLGAKSDAVMIRLMDKVIDTQRPDGTYLDLPENKKRVRVETTITGTELERLGVSDIPSLQNLRPEDLQRHYFRFMLPTFAHCSPPTTRTAMLGLVKDTARANTYLRSGVTGLASMEAGKKKATAKAARGMTRVLRTRGTGRARKRGNHRLRPPLVAWAEMNRNAHVALVNLGKREKTARARMRRQE
ncbi:hypothetical protein B6V74_13005 [Thioclava sp. F42-5]|uniref:hypothetical protein n=1 Tax=Thioclava sp. F42-5 TaxID=1973005 RepID=UPI000B541020|nr:hypothetical protein [Thioclava sp. F42-5]OWY08735.1 hypothetical protein B6V74_13005 [Thioclava sp. F42-5]